MIKEKFEGHILVVSNECFSETSSNGRTIMNFLRGIDPDQIGQFYIHGNPDKNFCHNYYQVSDKDALNAFLCRKVKKSPADYLEAKTVEVKRKKIKRNCRNLVFRNLIWSSFKWWNESFECFLNSLAPTVIVFQAGDMPFMFSIAMKISALTKIPLVMYNSEGYVLKDKLYNGVKKYSIWHMILQHDLKCEYKKMMDIVSYCVYSTEYLEQCYQEKYPHKEKSIALYTASEIQKLTAKREANEFHLLYCGNLGVGRADILDTIAKVLNDVDSKAILDIYGRFVTEKDREKVCANENVYYGGFVSYNEISRLMSEASMLLHCENPDRVTNLKHAFSTKIADLLASGRPFLVYASDEYPFVQYLKKNNCAHIASTPNELMDTIKLCISDKQYRYKYVDNAVRVANEKHNFRKNSDIFRAILNIVSIENSNVSLIKGGNI